MRWTLKRAGLVGKIIILETIVNGNTVDGMRIVSPSWRRVRPLWILMGWVEKRKNENTIKQNNKKPNVFPAFICSN
jgi:hypothetical protein